MIKQPHIHPNSEMIGSYVLLQDFTYKWHAKDFDRKLVIPKGFIFDLASVPRIFWTPTGISPDRLRWTAPLIHDFLYEYKGKLPEKSYFRLPRGTWIEDKKIWTRKNADKMFCRLMREDGISMFKRRMAYRAVRAGGWLAWKT